MTIARRRRSRIAILSYGTLAGGGWSHRYAVNDPSRLCYESPDLLDKHEILFNLRIMAAVLQDYHPGVGESFGQLLRLADRIHKILAARNYQSRRLNIAQLTPEAELAGLVREEVAS